MLTILKVVPCQMCIYWFSNIDFQFCQPKFGALPVLQEYPCIWNNLVCFTHLTIAGRKENIPFFWVLSDKMSKIKIDSLDEIFLKNHSPLPFSLVLVFIQPHRNSQSRDQQGHFHPLLVIKKTHAFRCTFTKGASSDVRLRRRKKTQVWVCHVRPFTIHYTES